MEPARLREEPEPGRGVHRRPREPGAFTVAHQQWHVPPRRFALKQARCRFSHQRKVAGDRASRCSVHEDDEVRVEAARVRPPRIGAAGKVRGELGAVIVRTPQEVWLCHRQRNWRAIFRFEEGDRLQPTGVLHARHFTVAQAHTEGPATVRVAHLRLAQECRASRQGKRVGGEAASDTHPYRTQTFDCFTLW